MPAHLRQRAQRLDHARCHVPGMWTREPDPVKARDLVEALQQSSEVAGGIVWRLVMVHDLSEELDLFGSRVSRVLRLGDDVAHWTHALLPARIRDDAEGAELVAPFDDRHVRLERIEAPRDPEWKRDVVERIQIQGRGSMPAVRVTFDRTIHQHRQALDVLRPDDHVDGARSREDGVTFLLRDASGDGDNRAVAGFEPVVMNFAEPREQLLFGLLANAARVDDDDIGVAIVVSGLVARLLEEAGHPLRVMKVHLTAERLDQVFLRHVVPLSPFAFSLLSLSPWRAVGAGRPVVVDGTTRRLACGAPCLEHLTGAGDHGG